MDIKAVSPGSGGASSLVTALPSIPADSRAVVTDVATSSGLNDGERTQLVQAVAAVDAGITSPALRSDVLSHVSGLGFYLKNTSDDGSPHWNVLTALRVYGLNLSESAPTPAPVATTATPAATTAPATPQPDEQVVAKQVKAKLDSVARSSRGVSLEHVAVAVKAAKSAPTQSNTPVDGHTVELVA